jgi:hypothetical protein
MEGNLGDGIEEKYEFERLLKVWPETWDGDHPSHIRRLYGLGYKGQLMHVEATAPEVLEGTVVAGTAPHDRPTTQLKAITGRPTPKELAGSVHPALRMGKPGGS